MKTYKELKHQHAVRNGYANWAELYYDNPPSVVDRHFEYVAMSYAKEVAKGLAQKIDAGVDEVFDVLPISDQKDRSHSSVKNKTGWTNKLTTFIKKLWNR